MSSFTRKEIQETNNIPLKQVKLMMNRISVEPGTDMINMGDFRAGSGESLRLMKECIQNSSELLITTYGCELNEEIVIEAKKNIEVMVRGDYQNIQTNQAFSLLLCNPPYQTLSNGQRAEREFLEAWTRKEQWLIDGGIFLLVIPQHILYCCSRLIASRLDDVRVYRFTDEHYDRINQVVVYGVSRSPKMPKKVEEYLQLVFDKGSGGLKPLDYEDSVTYIVPPSPRVTNFCGVDIKMEKVGLRASCEKLLKRIIPPEEPYKPKFSRPLLDLKNIHMAQLMLSGAADGQLGNLYLSTVTRQVTVKEPVYDLNGKHIHDIKRSFEKTFLRVFIPKGSELPPGVYELE